MKQAGIFTVETPTINVAKIEDTEDLQFLLGQIRESNTAFPFVHGDEASRMVMSDSGNEIIRKKNGIHLYTYARIGDFVLSNQTPIYTVVRGNGRERLDAHEIPSEFVDIVALRLHR